MHRLLGLAIGALLPLVAGAATFPYFQPATGVLKGNASTYVTQAAVSADIIGLWSGSCSAATFLQGAGACSSSLSGLNPTFTIHDTGSGNDRVRVVSDGGVLIGNPAGGSQGAGTINASALYIDGAPVGTSTGAVSSVGLAAPATFSVSGSPVTSAGTLTLGFASGQAANRVLATPDGTTGALSLRALVTGDIPAIPLTTGVTGTLPVANGGTGQTALSALTANPSASIGLSAVNGAASTFMRSDAAPVLSTSITPTWSATHTFATAPYSTGATNLSGFVTGTTSSTVASFLSNRAVTAHGIYGFADVGTVTPPGGGGINGHATFNDHITLDGSNNFDHHHSFQGWPILNNSGTLSRYSGVWINPNIQQGTITNMYLLHAAGISYAGGTIGTLEGLRIEDMSGVAGTTLAIHTLGTMPSLFGGKVTAAGGVAAGAASPLGSNTFQAADASAPSLGWTNTGAGANNKLWDMYPDTSGVFHCRMINDAVNAAADWCTVSRTGTTPTVINLTATDLQWNGVSLAGGSQTTGTFTGTLTGLSGAITCGMKYRKTGSLITLFVQAGTACTGTSVASSFTLIGLPVAIQPSISITNSSTAVLDNNIVTLTNADINVGVSPSTIVFSKSCTTCTVGQVTFSASLWTASGTKGLTGSWSMTYDLGN